MSDKIERLRELVREFGTIISLTGWSVDVSDGNAESEEALSLLKQIEGERKELVGKMEKITNLYARKISCPEYSDQDFKGDVVDCILEIKQWLEKEEGE